MISVAAASDGMRGVVVGSKNGNREEMVVREEEEEVEVGVVTVQKQGQRYLLPRPSESILRWGYWVIGPVDSSEELWSGPSGAVGVGLPRRDWLLERTQSCRSSTVSECHR